MKYLLSRDTIFATIAVFGLMGLLALLPLNTHLFDPIKLAFHDFDFNDLLYSKLGKNENQKPNDRIVVVNIQEAGRAEITQALQTIKAAKPTVIGMDILFEEAKDSVSDAVLENAIKSTPNLVLATRLTETEPPIEYSHFIEAAQHTGYVDFVGETGGVIRSFVPFITETGDASFAAQLTKLAAPEAYEKLTSRKNKLEYISYTHKPEQWMILNLDALSSTPNLPALLQDKIVLMGYVNLNENQIEDKHFTPMNAQFSGKSRPDMNGIFIHANILHMVLAKDYIHKIPGWLNWVIAFVIVWLHMAFFIKYYLDNHLWFHLAAKTMQVISAIAFVFIGLFLYSAFNLKLNMTATLAGIILAVDVIYFYEAFMVWLQKKYNVKSIFHGHQHH